jgi:hypothetical protein
MTTPGRQQLTQPRTPRTTAKAPTLRLPARAFGATRPRWSAPIKAAAADGGKGSPLRLDPGETITNAQAQAYTRDTGRPYRPLNGNGFTADFVRYVRNVYTIPGFYVLGSSPGIERDADDYRRATGLYAFGYDGLITPGFQEYRKALKPKGNTAQSFGETGTPPAADDGAGNASDEPGAKNGGGLLLGLAAAAAVAAAAFAR